MSPHRRTTPDDQMPPTAEVEIEPRRRFWTSEAIVGAIGAFVGFLPLALGGLMLWGHAMILADHVKQLEHARDEFAAKHSAYEARMSTIESTASADRAASDKREALIEKELRDISERLSALQASVDRLHHQ